MSGCEGRTFSKAECSVTSRPSVPRATYNELDDALDCLEGLTEKYLLTFGNRGRLLQGELRKLNPDWGKVFLQPWASRHTYHFVFNVLRGQARAEKYQRRALP